MKNKKYFLLSYVTLLFLPITIYAAPLRITEVQNLSFGLVSVGDGGTVSTDGNYTGDIMMFGENQNGIFEIKGNPDADVNINSVGEVKLKDGSNKINNVEFEVLEGYLINLGPTGIATITIKGTANISSGQEEGFYDDRYQISALYD